MVEGCKHHGVKEEYIAWLEAHEATPRKKATAFKRFANPPPGVVMTKEELALHTGKGAAGSVDANGSTPGGVGAGTRLCTACNGKVLEVAAGSKLRLHPICTQGGGRDLTHFLATVMYDPFYGMPESMGDMSEQHKAAIEDSVVAMLPGVDVTVVARLLEL
jgi:hypothetical protein